MKPKPMPFDRPCPKCGAKPNETCKNEEGLVIRGCHSERYPQKEDFSQAAARIVKAATERD